MYIDKKQAARLLINASIRNIFNGECPVANHVVVMSARQLMHEYADKHKIKLITDIRTYMKKNMIGEFEKFWKSRYNFFKHSRHDADEEVSLRNVNATNEFETLFNMQKYGQIWKEDSFHMRAFYIYLASLYPDKLILDNPGVPPEELERARRAIKANKGLSRSELCKLHQGLLDLPGAKQELSEARALSFADPTPFSGDERDKVDIRRKVKK